MAKDTLPNEVWVKVKPDPAGGWGGAPYPQIVRKSEPGAVRYVRAEDYDKLKSVLLEMTYLRDGQVWNGCQSDCLLSDIYPEILDLHKQAQSS